MASYIENDFEIINAPIEEAKPSIREREREPCGDPFCHKSHISWESEATSERAIEPVLTLMAACAKDLETKGSFFHTSTDSPDNSVNSKLNDINTMIFDTFCSGIPADKGKYSIATPARNSSATMEIFASLEKGYKHSVENVLRLFRRAIVGDEFFPKQVTIGRPQTGKWHHMSVVFDSSILKANDSLDSQDTQTSYQMLERVLMDNSAEVIAPHKAPIEYLKDAADKLNQQGVTFPLVKDPVTHHNLTTKHARSAFPGCLASLRGGQDFETLKQNWMTKADPHNYMRPKAAPSTGNIESAEKIFARLGYTTRDLKRDFLSVNQIPESAFIWTQKPLHKLKVASENSQPITSDAPKLFSDFLSIKEKRSALSYTDAPIQGITFRKFTFKVLHTASELHIPLSDEIQPYFFTTGKPNSKPIMSFHNEDGHTASWYIWRYPALLDRADLKEEWTPVTGIVSFPRMWDKFSSAIDAFDETKARKFKFKRNGIRFMFCLEGAKDLTVSTSLCLFPTLMKGEFHGVRKTVEAFSNRGRLGLPEGTTPVGGIEIAKDRYNDIVVGVRTKEGQVSRYRIVLFE